MQFPPIDAFYYPDRKTLEEHLPQIHRDVLKRVRESSGDLKLSELLAIEFRVWCGRFVHPEEGKTQWEAEAFYWNVRVDVHGATIVHEECMAPNCNGWKLHGDAIELHRGRVCPAGKCEVLQ